LGEFGVERHDEEEEEEEEEGLRALLLMICVFRSFEEAFLFQLAFLYVGEEIVPGIFR